VLRGCLDDLSAKGGGGDQGSSMPKNYPETGTENESRREGICIARSEKKGGGREAIAKETRLRLPR